MSSNLTGFGIHGNASYQNFEFSFFTFPMLLLFLPILYIPITIIVILRIIVKLYYAKRDKNVNFPLFYVICISNITINDRLIRIGLPIIFIYPFFFVFFLFPAYGYCFPARGPFPFGAILIGFAESLFGLRNNYFLLFNSLFWMSCCLFNNSILLVKLVRLKSSLSVHAKSQVSHKAEVSLTFTTFSMVLSYLSNSMIVITSQLWGDLTFYAIMLRPFGNDLETCVVPWVLYLTHPVFRKRKSSTPVRVIHREKPNS